MHVTISYILGSFHIIKSRRKQRKRIYFFDDHRQDLAGQFVRAVEDHDPVANRPADQLHD